MSLDFFSISEGGPFHKVLVKLHLYKKPGRLIIVFLSLTWLPLFIITAFEGTLYSGVQTPFLKDIAIQMRLLVTLPLFLIISLVVDSKAVDMQKYFSETLMKDNEQQLFLSKILKGTRKLANSALMELILLLIVIAITINFGKGGLWNEFHTQNESWKEAFKDGNNIFSLAGNWSGFISIPLFQFLLLRWLWRYIIWVWLLFRLSRSRLTLKITHPDKAGGLGIVIHVQKFFLLLFVAFCLVVSGELTAQLLLDPASFPAISGEAIGYIVICILLLILPLIFFTAKLIRTKHDGILKLSNLGTSLSGKFENEWINDITIEKKVKESMVSTSTLQDYSTIYKSLQQLQPISVSLKDFIFIIIVLLIPFTPILFIHFSIGELFLKLVGLLV